MLFLIYSPLTQINNLSLSVETREVCRKSAAETPEPRCITEVTKRDQCTMIPNGPIKCRGIEDDVHEISKNRWQGEARRGKWIGVAVGCGKICGMMGNARFMGKNVLVDGGGLR